MSQFLPAPRGYRKKVIHQSGNVEISRLEKVEFRWWWLLALIAVFLLLIYFDVLSITVLSADGVQIFTTE